MAKLIVMVVAALGLAAAADKKCHFEDANPTGKGPKCYAGCLIEKTQKCAIDCPYKVIDGKCSK